MTANIVVMVMQEATAREFRARLHRFVRGHVPSDADADDVVQEVLLRLWQRRDEVDPAATPAWLFMVARNAIADFHRGRGRRPEPLASDFDAPEPKPEQRRSLADCLVPMLEDLDADDRDVLQRIDLRDGSQQDLARELGLSPSGAKSRVQRARARLLRAVADCCRVELDRRGLPLDDHTCRRDCGGDRPSQC